MSFTILDRKDDEVAPLPLLLVGVTWPTGEALHLCSHVIPITYGGVTYTPRLLNQQIAAQAILSQEGLTSTPNVSLQLEDADKYYWSTTELARGWKGATITAFFVFYDPITNEYSTDAYTKFIGVSNPAGGDDGSLSVSALSKMQMALLQLPTTRVSRTCPWMFPQTAAQRQAAADDPSNVFNRCGYSPDATGANARGNYNPGGGGPTVAYTSCDKTISACAFRGMYVHDSSNRATGRFGGIQWAPPGTYNVRPYGGKWEQLFNQDNQAKYNDFVPMCFGLVMIDPAPVLDVAPDGNYVHSEVLINDGKVWDIQLVLVNDEQLPHTYNDTRISTLPGVTDRAGALTIGFWQCVNDGRRDGYPNQDAMYNGRGDPFGSLAVIEVVPVVNIAGSGSAPTVRVLAKCGEVPVYTDPTTFTLAYSNNPAWILLYLLLRSNWDISEIDIPSFFAAAATYDTSIPYQTISGSTSTHAAYACNIVIRNRRSLADVTRGILNACGSYLTQDWQAGGKLQLWHESTICEQQPAPIPGSNDNVAIPGLKMDGSTSTGYSAYLFDESTILRENGKTTLTVSQAPLSQTPNLEGVQFWNEENRYSQDIATLADTEDIARMWAQPGNAQLDGATNFDQIYRMLARMTAKSYRGNTRNDIVGNPIGDTGGTIAFTFKTTFRAIHLRIGQIVTFTSQHYDLTRQLFRVTNIQPSTDFRVLTVTIQFHNDIWYLWTFGQAGQPSYSSPFRNANQKTPQIWNPYTMLLDAQDSMYPGADAFRVAALYEASADGSSIAHARIIGRSLINALAVRNPPYMPIQGGSVSSTGGSILGGRNVYVAIAGAATDALGLNIAFGPLSEITTVAVPSGTNTNTISIGNIAWNDAGATTWGVWAGYSPNHLSLQTAVTGSGGTLPTSITMTAVTPGDNPPDAIADHVEFQYKRINVPGVWIAQVLSVTSTTITVALPAGATFGVNQWANYDLSCYGAAADVDVPPCNFRIASNDAAGVLSLASGTPNPTAVPSYGDPPATTLGLTTRSLDTGDWVCCRASLTSGIDPSNGLFVEDANFVNAFLSAGFVADQFKGQVLRIISGTGAATKYKILGNTATRFYLDGDAWIVAPDSTTRAIIEDPAWVRSIAASNVKNADINAAFETLVDVPNYAGQAFLIAGVTETADGTASPEGYAPFRELLIVGDPGNGSTQSALNLTVDGTLGTIADASKRIAPQQDVMPQAIRVQVKQAAAGADIHVTLYGISTGTTVVWAGLTLVLPAGQTSVYATPTQMAALTAIPAGTSVRQDIAIVGAATFPGSDLSTSIYL